jgi:hypothetical protein
MVINGLVRVQIKTAILMLFVLLCGTNCTLNGVLVGVQLVTALVVRVSVSVCGIDSTVNISLVGV